MTDKKDIHNAPAHAPDKAPQKPDEQPAKNAPADAGERKAGDGKGAVAAAPEDTFAEGDQVTVDLGAVPDGFKDVKMTNRLKGLADMGADKQTGTVTKVINDDEGLSYVVDGPGQTFQHVPRMAVKKAAPVGGKK